MTLPQKDTFLQVILWWSRRFLMFNLCEYWTGKGPLIKHFFVFWANPCDCCQRCKWSRFYCISLLWFHVIRKSIRTIQVFCARHIPVDISQTKPAIYRTWFSGTPSVNKTGANKEKCNAKYLNRTQKAQVWDILVNQEMLCFVLMLLSPASPAQGHDWGGWSMVLLLLGWHLQSAGI